MVIVNYLILLCCNAKECSSGMKPGIDSIEKYVYTILKEKIVFAKELIVVKTWKTFTKQITILVLDNSIQNHNQIESTISTLLLRMLSKSKSI